MYKNIGIDIASKKQFENLTLSSIKRILTKKEFDIYLQTHNNYKVNFLTGRWTAKEAVYKAVNKMIKINLVDIEILNDENGKPFCNNIDNVIVSISHTDLYTVSMAFYEENLKK